MAKASSQVSESKTIETKEETESTKKKTPAKKATTKKTTESSSKKKAPAKKTTTKKETAKSKSAASSKKKAEEAKAAQVADIEDEEKRNMLTNFSFICMLSFDVYVKKMLIEKLIDSCSAKETDTTEHRSRHSRSDKK